MKADNSYKAQKEYKKLFYGEKDYKDLTDEDQKFVKKMYHLEEYKCGLG